MWSVRRVPSPDGQLRSGLIAVAEVGRLQCRTARHCSIVEAVFTFGTPVAIGTLEIESVFST